MYHKNAPPPEATHVYECNEWHQYYRFRNARWEYYVNGIHGWWVSFSEGRWDKLSLIKPMSIEEKLMEAF